ncbi:hypothetical protein U9M48_005137, partial [Paspalum notatum var. saurae]
VQNRMHQSHSQHCNEKSNKACLIEIKFLFKDGTNKTSRNNNTKPSSNSREISSIALTGTSTPLATLTFLLPLSSILFGLKPCKEFAT